jgi:hypothetical protein
MAIGVYDQVSTRAILNCMSKPAEILLDESVSTPNDTRWIECFNCKVPCSHRVVARAEVEWSVAEGAGRERVVHELVQCGGCHKVGYSAVTSLFSNDQEESVLSSEELYPPREDRTKKTRKWMDNLQRVPKRPRTIYMETLRAFNSGLHVLTGVGIRTIVETVCKHKRLSGVDLQRKIDALGSAELLGIAEVKLMHRLRFLGNRAVHEGNPPSKEDLEAGIDIAEHLLRAVYIVSTMGRGLPRKSRVKANP